MNKHQIVDIISKLSADAFAYFFPGGKKPDTAVISEFDYAALEEPASDIAALPGDSGIRFRVSREESPVSFKVSSEKNDSEVRFSVQGKDVRPGRVYEDIFQDESERDIRPKAKRSASVARKKVSLADESRKMLRKVVREPAIKDQPLDPKTQALLEEIKALQEKYGVTIDEFEAVLSYTVKLSRLRITRRKEIILEDFDQREVKMDTLTKAVFLLYLDHPEGIRFKDLADYRMELEGIYMSISGRSDLQAMKKSLDDLTNSIMSNSISEKVSKARKAFRDVVDERVAKFYYIDGKSGEPKKIAFDRSLVIRD